MFAPAKYCLRWTIPSIWVSFLVYYTDFKFQEIQLHLEINVSYQSIVGLVMDPSVDLF